MLCESRLLLAGHNPGIDWFPLIEKLQKQANDEVAFGNWNNLSERLSSGSSDSSIASRTQVLCFHFPQHEENEYLISENRTRRGRRPGWELFQAAKSQRVVEPST